VIAVRGVRYDLKNVPSDFELLAAQDADPEDLARLALAAAIKSLYAWKWEEASELSRTCLKHSKKEDLRDEALNVLAATLLARGEAAKALDALRKAVEGEWNLALQTNLAVVASEADPAIALEHMSYLIAGAEDSEQRRQAALLAVALWKRLQGEEKESEDEDDFDPPPRSVLDAIYNLLVSSDLTEENFYDLGMFLARVDADWLNKIDLYRGKESLHFFLFKYSPHQWSPSARLIKARVKGFLEFVAEFGPVTKAQDDLSRPWIMNAIESYVQMIGRMIANSDDAEGQKIAIMHAYKLFDTGMPKNSVARVLLLAVMILNFDTILREDGAPKDVVDEWLTYAFQNVRDNKVEMVGDQRDSLFEAIASAAYTLVQFRHKEIIPTLREADNQSLIIKQKTSGFFSSFTVDRAEVRAVARPIVDFCSESKKTYYRLLPMLRDEKARESVNTILIAIVEIEGRLSGQV
jgi:hypothetical protein